MEHMVTVVGYVDLEDNTDKRTNKQMYISPTDILAK